MNIYTELEVRTLLQELLDRKRVGQKVIVMEYSTNVETVYTSKNACAKALGVHQSSIVEKRPLKKGKYIITLVGPITLSMNKSEDILNGHNPPFSLNIFNNNTSWIIGK